MSILSRLFGTKPHPLVGTRMHAWFYGASGWREVEGEVIDVGDGEIALDPSKPEQQEYRATVTVWKADARPVGVALPVLREVEP